MPTIELGGRRIILEEEPAVLLFFDKVSDGECSPRIRGIAQE